MGRRLVVICNLESVSEILRLCWKEIDRGGFCGIEISSHFLVSLFVNGKIVIGCLFLQFCRLVF